MPKPALLDPQGVAVREAMEHLGLHGVSRVRVGKQIEIEFRDRPSDEQLHEICRDLLSNPVVEDYHLELEP